MVESLLFHDDLWLTEGAIFRVRYYIIMFQFCMHDFFVFLNICEGDLFLHKILSSRSKSNEKVSLALKNTQEWLW